MDTSSTRWYHAIVLVISLVGIGLAYLLLYPILTLLRYSVIGLLRYTEWVVWIGVVGSITYLLVSSDLSIIN